MASVIEVTHGGHTLSKSHVTHLIKEGVKHDVPPSLFICQLYYESNWGNSQVARDNNNWGGLTWTGSTTRPSGIIVSRGTARPSSEGGYYMRFSSVNDYLTDYVYLLTEQGIYNIQGHSTFERSVKGLFIVGGAAYDYAAVGATAYISTMVSIRNSMNNGNNDFLTKIDNNPNDYVDGTSPDPDPDPDPDPIIDIDFSSVTSFFKTFSDELVKNIEKMLIVNLYDYGKSKTFGNSFLKVDKTYSNMYKIKPTLNFKSLVDDLIKNGLSSLGGILDNIEPEISYPDPDPDPDPDPNGKVFFPVKYNASGINFWSPPYNDNLTHDMDYGERSNGVWHAGYDIGGGGIEHNIYATTKGIVKKVTNDGNARGFYITIEHETDKYSSLYQHLKSNSNVVNVGDKVKAGQKIAVMGSTGGNYAIHLHYELSPNGTFNKSNTIDPKPYLKVTGNNKTSLPNP